MGMLLEQVPVTFFHQIFFSLAILPDQAHFGKVVSGPLCSLGRPSLSWSGRPEGQHSMIWIAI